MATWGTTTIPHTNVLILGELSVNGIFFSYWAKLCPEALDTVVENAVELLKELFR